MEIWTTSLTLSAVLRVEEKDVGEVLLLLGFGIPLAAFLGGVLHYFDRGDLGNLVLSGAVMGVLPFLMLSCQAATG